MYAIIYDTYTASRKILTFPDSLPMSPKSVPLSEIGPW